MFDNFIAIAHMRSPVATIEPIILDSIISAAKAKDILKDKYYSSNNTYGSLDLVRETLSAILDIENKVFCTSQGISDSKEYVGSWAKRWNNQDIDLIKFKGRGKKRIDIGGGHYKNYHMPMVLQATNKITFYVRGDLKEIERLLKEYIHYLGKKSSQGYGQIKRWEFKKIEENKSVWKNNKPNRPIPVEECETYIKTIMKKKKHLYIKKHPIVPPYWRREKETCLMPGR